MRLGTRILSFALALLMAGLGLAGGAAVAGEGKKWTAEDYRTRAVKKWKSLFYYRPDGTALAKAWGKGWKHPFTGTWKIEGDRFCTTLRQERQFRAHGPSRPVRAARKRGGLRFEHRGTDAPPPARRARVLTDVPAIALGMAG